MHYNAVRGRPHGHHFSLKCNKGYSGKRAQLWHCSASVSPGLRASREEWVQSYPYVQTDDEWRILRVDLSDVARRNGGYAPLPPQIPQARTCHRTESTLGSCRAAKGPYLPSRWACACWAAAVVDLGSIRAPASQVGPWPSSQPESQTTAGRREHQS